MTPNPFFLAAAARSLFPEASLLNIGVGSSFFFIDLQKEGPWEEYLVHELQSKLKEVLKTPFRCMEMERKNGALFLEKRGFLSRAQEAIKKSATLLPVIEIGSFYADFSEEEFDPTLFSPFQKIVEVVPLLEGDVFRIIAIGSQERDVLKEHIKRWIPLGCQAGEVLLREIGWKKNILNQEISLPKAVTSLEIILSFWKKSLEQQGGCRVQAQASSLKEEAEIHHQLEIGMTGELSLIEGVWSDRIYIKGRESVTSGLHLMEKFLRMFGLNLRQDLKLFSSSKKVREKLLKEGVIVFEKKEGPLLEASIQDVFGEWGALCLLEESLKGMMVLSLLQGNLLERLIERGLPFCLEPEQVRIIECDGSSEWGCAVFDELQKGGFRVTLDARSGELKERMREALQERVPFSIVIGKKEKQDQTISVRSWKTDEIEQMSLGPFIARLKTIENQ